MRTSDDADLEIPPFDFERARRAIGPRFEPPVEIGIDGAVGYALRLIPSNKQLGRFTSTLEAWPAIVAELDAGRSPRTLVLDWVGAGGSVGLLAAGRVLESHRAVERGIDRGPETTRAAPASRRRSLKQAPEPSPLGAPKRSPGRM